MVAQARRALQLQLDEGVPRDPAGQRAALGRLVQEETARLQRRKADHERREAADRAELADRLAVDTTEDGERMRRYQLDFDRKLHRALNSLLKLRRAEGVGGNPDAGGAPEPDPADPVEPGSGGGNGPRGEGQPKDEGGMRDDAGVAADRLPSSLSFILASSSFATPEPADPAAPEPPSAEIAAPARADAEPQGHPVPQNELTPPAGADPTAQNEPSPAGGGEENSRNEPTASGRVAALIAPALVLALVILWAIRLSAARAAPIAGPTSKADASGDGRFGLAGARAGSDRRGPFESVIDDHPAGFARQRTGNRTPGDRSPGGPTARAPGCRPGPGPAGEAPRTALELAGIRAATWGTRSPPDPKDRARSIRRW